MDRLPIGQRVLVKEFGIEGWVYESGMPERGTSEADRIYGVRLDKVVFPKNFVATIVWHCSLEELELLEGNQKGE